MSDVPEAVILAGGLGTRLRSLVADRPKPMAPVGGRPFLELLLDSLARKGLRRVVLSVGYRAAQIREHFGSRYGAIQLAYSEEDQPLGTGGALRLALTHCTGDAVLVFNGDTFIDLDTEALMQLWHRTGEPLLVARQVADTRRYGRLEIDAEGHVLRFLDQGSAGPGPINAGCYLIPRNLLDGWSAGSAFSLEREFLVEAVRQRRFRAFVSESLFIDIGVPDDYLRAQHLLAGP